MTLPELLSSLYHKARLAELYLVLSAWNPLLMANRAVTELQPPSPIVIKKTRLNCAVCYSGLFISFVEFFLWHWGWNPKLGSGSTTATPQPLTGGSTTGSHPSPSLGVLGRVLPLSHTPGLHMPPHSRYYVAKC